MSKILDFMENAFVIASLVLKDSDILKANPTKKPDPLPTKKPRRLPTTTPGRLDHKEIMRRAEEERQEALKNQAEFICKYANSEASIFIDSNLWMDKSYHNSISRFCMHYSESRAPLLFHGEQYAEIQRVRKRTATAAPGEEKLRNGAASGAVRLIRDLAKKGQLELKENEQAPLHVDDYIVAQAKSALKAGKRFLLVTKDVELQTRVFTIKARGGKDLCEVLTGEEFIALYRPGFLGDSAV